MQIAPQFLTFYGILVGFALAGVAASASEYVTEERLRFGFDPRSGFIAGFGGLIIRLIAGPYLVARFFRTPSEEGYPSLLVLGASALVLSWSFALGILALSTLVM